MPLLFDPKTTVVQLNVDKATGNVTMDASEDIAYPVLVDMFLSVLQSVTRTVMAAHAMANPNPAPGPGIVPPGVRPGFPGVKPQGPLKLS